MADSWTLVGGPAGASGPDGKGGVAGVLAVHAALLPIGKGGSILYYAGDQWIEPSIWEQVEIQPNPESDPRFTQGLLQIDHTRIFDCTTQAVFNPGSPADDIFCSGHAFLPDGRLVVVGGTQHFPEGPGNLHVAHWSGSRDTWIFSHADFAFRGAPTSPVTALWNVSRKHLDVFMTDSSGIVWSTWWEQGPGWQYWFPIHPEQKAAPGAKVSASWAAYDANGHLDLFITASDGVVHSTFYTPQSGWVNWFPISPSQKMAPGAPITVVWAAYSEFHLDIFVTGADGTVWSSFWEVNKPWTSWFTPSPAHKAVPGAQITASWAHYSNEHLDLFMTGTDGTVWSCFWDGPNKGWQAWFSIWADRKMAPGSTVTALWTPYDGNHLDIFVTDATGVVWSSFWIPDAPWEHWFSITGPLGNFDPRSTVTAVWAPYSNKHLDLFVTGNDGMVWSTFWDGARGWQAWFVVGSGQQNALGSEVAAVWSPVRANHLDLFIASKTGIWESTWWEGPTGWTVWFSIPKTNPWKKGPELNRDPAQGGTGGGRWYPSVISLSDGSVFAHTGHPVIWNFTSTKPDSIEAANSDVRHNNTKPDIIDHTGTTCSIIDKAIGQSGVHNFAVFYPRMFVMPHTGDLFIVQPLYSSAVTLGGDPETLGTGDPLDVHPPYNNVMDNSIFYNVKNQTVIGGFRGPQFFDANYLNPSYTSQQTSGVLLPLLHEENYKARVLLTGAFKPLIVDLDESNPQTNAWRETAPRTLLDPTTHAPPFRNFCNTTLLPTGDVAITGGVREGSYSESPTDFKSGGVKHVEIYHPPWHGQPDSWSVGAMASEVRGYHSSALLMPDGRVWTAGSEIENFVPKQNPTDPDNPKVALPKLAVELYAPSYYADRENRLQIVQAPTAVSYGLPFNITISAPTDGLDNTGMVTRVVFMRFGSSTHSFDGDQRYVSVPYTQARRGTQGLDSLRYANTVVVTAPPDGTVAPPGYYMLWVLDVQGKPCIEAWILRLHVKDFILHPFPISIPSELEVDQKAAQDVAKVGIRKEDFGEDFTGWRVRGKQ